MNKCQKCGSANTETTEQEQACCHDCGAEWDTSLTHVIFRKWRKKPRTCIAWLFGIPARLGRVMAYEHVGQHGEGTYPLDTVPATPEEYADLKAELESIGYRLRVTKRK